MFMTSRLIFSSINSTSKKYKFPCLYTSIELAQIGSLEWNTDFHRAKPCRATIWRETTTAKDWTKALFVREFPGLEGTACSGRDGSEWGGICSFDGMVKLFPFWWLWTFIEVFHIDNDICILVDFRTSDAFTPQKSIILSLGFQGAPLCRVSKQKLAFDRL